HRPDLLHLVHPPRGDPRPQTQRIEPELRILAVLRISGHLTLRSGRKALLNPNLRVVTVPAPLRPGREKLDKCRRTGCGLTLTDKPSFFTWSFFEISLLASRFTSEQFSVFRTVSYAHVPSMCPSAALDWTFMTSKEFVAAAKAAEAADKKALSEDEKTK